MIHPPHPPHTPSRKGRVLATPAPLGGIWGAVAPAKGVYAMNGGLGMGSRLWAILAALVLFCIPVPLAAQDDNVHLLALTVLYEATGQPRLGQELVARVVANRAAGTPYLEAVVFSDGQFVAWTPARRWAFLWCQIEEGSNPACFDRMALEWLSSAPDARERWLDLLAMSQAVLNGTPEPVGWEGVLNFDNPRFWPDGEPPWAYAKVFMGCVCDHCFWR